MKYRIPVVVVAPVLALGLVLACGGGKPAEAPEQTTTTPPNLPPSMAGGGGPAATSTPQETPATKGPSDEVIKGMKALEANDTTAAKAYALAALKKNPKEADAFTLLGMALERSNDKAGAETAYKEALQTRPDLEAASVNLSAMYADGEKWDDAEKVSRAGIQKHVDNAALHLNLAIALAGKKNPAESGKEFDEAERLSPKQPMPLLVHAHWLGAWNQSDAAVAKLRAARSVAGDDVAMLASIGEEFRLVRAVTDCIATFDKAVALQDVAELRTERGLCKLGAKDAAGALADFQAAIAKDASYALAHYWLGGLLAKSGKGKEAQAEFETYLKLAPTGPKAQAAKDGLAKLKRRPK